MMGLITDRASWALKTRKALMSWASEVAPQAAGVCPCWDQLKMAHEKVRQLTTKSRRNVLLLPGYVLPMLRATLFSPPLGLERSAPPHR